MSIFASLRTATVHPVADPTALIVVQKLSGRAVEIAQAAHAEGVFAGLNGRGWSSRFLKRLESGTATEKEAEQFIEDPLFGFDRFTVVRQGIRSWSFTTEVDGVSTPKPINDATVRDIDDETLEELALAIMRLTKPERFKTDEQLETERKNG